MPLPCVTLSHFQSALSDVKYLHILDRQLKTHWVLELRKDEWPIWNRTPPPQHFWTISWSLRTARLMRHQGQIQGPCLNFDLSFSPGCHHLILCRPGSPNPSNSNESLFPPPPPPPPFSSQPLWLPQNFYTGRANRKLSIGCGSRRLVLKCLPVYYFYLSCMLHINLKKFQVFQRPF